MLDPKQPNYRDVPTNHGVNQSLVDTQIEGSAVGSGLKGEKEKAAEERKKKIIKYGLIGGGVVLLLVLIIVLSVTLSGGDKPPTPVIRKYNPYKLSGAMPSEKMYPYKIQMSAPKQSLQQGMSVGAAGPELTVNPQAIPIGANNKFSSNIQIQFWMADYQCAYMTVEDKDDATKWKIPDSILKTSAIHNAMRLELLGFQAVHADDGAPYFEFVNTRNPKDWYVSTEGQTLFMTDKYIQMDFKLPTQRLFGFGQRHGPFALTQGSWSMWARGGDTQVEDDGQGGKSSYGVHPFLLIQTKDPSEFIGMYFKNSNAQSPVIKFEGDGTSTLSYITTGGVIEVYFFIKGSVQKIVSDYQDKISGRPSLPPFWSLGFAQASRTFVSDRFYTDMVQKYDEALFPLETIMVDSKYMFKYQNFGFNKGTFDLDVLGKTMHTKNKRMVVMIDAGVNADDEKHYQYREAYTNGCLIRSTHKPYKGWTLSATTHPNNNATVFYDWLHPVTKNIWGSNGLLQFSDKVDYDGIWLDKNEYETMCHGECPPETNTAEDEINEESDAGVFNSFIQFLQYANSNWYRSDPQDKITTHSVPFVPINQGDYDQKTLSLNATHTDEHEISYTEWNVHNLNAMLQCKTAFEIFTNPLSGYSKADYRPFILSRGTFTGSGKYTSHWLGQNQRSWSAMKNSVAGIMNMNMFGIQHSGASICGYQGGALDLEYFELCGRWAQLGAFYPLAMSDTDDDKFFMLNMNAEYKNRAIDALMQRMEYLRLQYTCLYEASINGKTCFNPLFYYYPEDGNTFIDIEHTFIVGNAIKVSPVFSPRTQTILSYFPKGKWVSMNNFNEVINSNGQFMELNAQAQYVPVHLMPGKIIPWQSNRNGRDVTAFRLTKQLLEKTMAFVINRDDNGYAEGSAFFDMGLLRSDLKEKYNYYQITHSSNSINFMDPHNVKDHLLPTDNNNQIMDRIIITNAEDIKDTDFVCYFDHELNIFKMLAHWNQDDRTLTISQFQEAVKWNDIREIHYGNSGRDFNLCETKNYNWKVVDSSIDLGNSFTQFIIRSEQPNTQQDMRVQMTILKDGTLNVNINYAAQKEDIKVPFQPEGVVNPEAKQRSQTLQLQNYVNISSNPFYFMFVNPNNKSQIWLSTKDQMLMFQEYFVLWGAQVYTPPGAFFHGIYGLGQRITNEFFLKNGVYSMWARDKPESADEGIPPGKNMYGVHPFYMGQLNSNVGHFGVASINPSAQDWYVHNNHDTGIITLKNALTGGIIDMYFMIGILPDLVIDKYHNLVGRQTMPPLWALGWHQCRWGYTDLPYVQNVVKRFDDEEIPLDVMWSDIDYMDNYRDFTYDNVKFEGLPQFINDLHGKKQYWVPIIDAGIAYRPNGNYEAFNDGEKRGAFIKAHKDKLETFVGRVWPNEAAFVDFVSASGKQFWIDWLGKMQTEVGLKFDGLWMDMNENANFCDGACMASQKASNPVKAKLKYIPSHRDLETNSIQLDAIHQDARNELDHHSMSAYRQLEATHQYFQNNNKRSFTLSRSSFTGIQKFGGQWLGDNFSTYEYLKHSVYGIMMMNVFGITMSGADICGFMGSTTADLCARWSVVGAFYPFSRNHNNWGEIPQEPYVWKGQHDSDGHDFMDTIKAAYVTRYHFAKYMYTQLYNINKEGGGYFKPMFFYFADDANTYTNIENNIMLGEALKLSVNAGTNNPMTEFYFPKGTWCNILGRGMMTNTCLTSAAGSRFTWASKASNYYVHLNEGNIVPMVNATALKIKRIMNILEHPVDFHMLGDAMESDTSLSAWGTYMNDDGLTNLDQQPNKHNYYNVSLSMTYSETIIKQVIIEITWIKQATDYPLDANNCRTINKGDYVGKFYIYNALIHRLARIDWVQKIAQDKDRKDLHSNLKVEYDELNDRLVIDTEAGLCLNVLNRILLTHIL